MVNRFGPYTIFNFKRAGKKAIENSFAKIDELSTASKGKYLNLSGKLLLLKKGFQLGKLVKSVMNAIQFLFAQSAANPIVKNALMPVPYAITDFVIIVLNLIIHTLLLMPGIFTVKNSKARLNGGLC
jgi:hypothetical protein